jgi:hypothetical protein
MKQLLELCIWGYTTRDICKLFNDNKDHLKYKQELPEFCITPDNTIHVSKEYFQFFDGATINEVLSDNKYILFSNKTAHEFIHEEISNSGFEDFLKYLHLTYTDFLKLSLNTPSGNQIPLLSRIVVDMNFLDYGEDFEVSYQAIGYLDSNMELAKFGEIE